MGSLGPMEILVVLVAALVVLGPKRLPDAARQMGRALAELRRVSSDLQAEVRDAFQDIEHAADPNYAPIDRRPLDETQALEDDVTDDDVTIVVPETDLPDGGTVVDLTEPDPGPTDTPPGRPE